MNNVSDCRGFWRPTVKRTKPRILMFVASASSCIFLSILLLTITISRSSMSRIKMMQQQVSKHCINLIIPPAIVVRAPNLHSWLIEALLCHIHPAQLFQICSSPVVWAVLQPFLLLYFSIWVIKGSVGTKDQYTDWVYGCVRNSFLSVVCWKWRMTVCVTVGSMINGIHYEFVPRTTGQWQ